MTGERNHFYEKHHSEETKEKIRKSLPPREGENNSFFGKSHSEESKEKMRGPRPGMKPFMKGKKHPEEVIQRIKETKKRNGSNLGGRNPKAKSVEINGITYATMKEAQEKTGKKRSEIRKIQRSQK